MNILPKKRWHVRTKENIARVRRDEAKLAEEIKRETDRQAQAEREHRTRLLRLKAAEERPDGLSLDIETDTCESVPSTSDASNTQKEKDITTDASGHVNFFADLEEQERTFGKNKEHEEEKKKEKEEWEQKIGILKYLGEGSAEYMKNVPWYQKAPKRAAEDSKVTTTEKTTRSIPKHSLVKSEVPENNTTVTGSSTIVFPSDLDPQHSESEIERRRRRKRKRKHSHSHSKKKRKKEKRKSNKKIKRPPSDSSSSSHSHSGNEDTGRTASASILQLRAQRIKREEEERRKAEKLLRKLNGVEDTVEHKKEPPPTYERKYNSQFNPEFAKQNKITG